MEFAFEAEAFFTGIATPQIINSDQGSQFTSRDWIDFLTQKNIQISRDRLYWYYEKLPKS